MTDVERRQPSRGRVVQSRGPIIRTLELLAAVTGVVAVGALVVALSTFGNRLATIQDARQRSALDTCQTLVQLIRVSGRLGGKEAQARTFIRDAGLGDCRRYALRVRLGKPNPTPGGQ